MVSMEPVTYDKVYLLKTEMLIARVRKWLVFLGLAIGGLTAKVGSLTVQQGLTVLAIGYYCYWVEGYYRSHQSNYFKYTSVILDFAMLAGILDILTGFHFNFLFLFVVNAICLAFRFAFSGWPLLLLNGLFLLASLHINGSLTTAYPAMIWLSVISALIAYLAQEHKNMYIKMLFLHRLSQVFNSSLREKQVQEITVRELRSVWSDCDYHLAMLNEDDEFVVTATSRPEMLGKLDFGSIITPKLIHENEPILVKDTSQDNQVGVEFLKKIYLRSVLLLPIKDQERAFGVLILESKPRKKYSLEDTSMLMMVSGQLAVSLANARLYEQTKNLAHMDELTGVWNRRAFFDIGKTEIKRAEGKGNQYKVTVVIIDVDSFKQINDRLGHPGGDSILKRVSALISSNLRQQDSLARIGGDEFAIILPDTNQRDAVRVMERIRQAVEEKGSINHKTTIHHKVTISVGLASYPEDGNDLMELIRKADQSLYSAKTKGRNQVCGGLFHDKNSSLIVEH